jgi:dolichol-phosphate mannosyltransferase
VSSPPELSLVVPCFNEAEVLPVLKSRIVQCVNDLARSWEVILVDDGSTDRTFDVLAGMHREEPRFKVLALSRNFGQQTAISAGLSKASGDAVAILDADLQDPPELLRQCMNKLREGYDVVYAVRRKRQEGFVSRLAYGVFYRAINFLADTDIPLDAGDFCVMTRRVADELTCMRERNVFLRGLRAWTGFRQAGVEYERPARAAGKSKYPFSKLVSLAMDGVFSFSILPLRLATFVGFGAVVLSLSMGLLHVVWRIAGFRLMGHKAAELPGWTTLASGMFFFAGLQLLILGIIGEYIGRIYTEIKQRPRWIVRESLGLENGDKEVSRGPH